MPDPVVILAMPHCGAARVAAMLGMHTQAYALPELNLFMTDRLGDLLSTFRRSESRLEDGLLRLVAQLQFGGQTRNTVEQARQWLESRGQIPVATLTRELLQKVAPLHPVLPDTSAGWRPQELDALLERHPQARYIHLVRHPRAHGDAAIEALAGRLFIAPDWKDHFGGVSRVDPQLAWLRVQANLQGLAAMGEQRYHLLRLEDLRIDTQQTLANLCDWLGWSTDEAEIEAMQHPESSDYAGFGPDNAPFGAEPEVLERPRFIQDLEEVPPLSEPPPWRADARPFAVEVVALAQAFGYD
ncbi:sulfotransferase [Algiphilus sp. W345]|uniref:Sulfotransferase n=1 Tax=Banduia mediterranea TaxID=3075609 RepID=A0ABU2WI87_9GAMM|nr:sulfotransferase [Algiphilus sp. W345]MDT0497584.1 sulfotransferase [Algiphilus sp. W345]